MYDEIFKEIQLTVIELPVEFVENKPVYSIYIRELPFLSADASSLKEAYRKLTESYQEYRETLQSEEPEKDEKPDLTVDELLRYYDGETMDGFADYFSNEQGE